MEEDWKLRLRYGKLSTPYTHYTVLADGEVRELTDDFECKPGKAWMAMKAWSNSADEATDMIQEIGEQVGFIITGKIMVYTTEPVKPPSENPHAYDINFTPYNEE